jgi:hypothetical protein
MPEPQNYKNHAQFFPLFHFVLVPILLFNLIWQVVRLFQEPSWDRGEFVLLSLGFIILAVASRLQSLKVQDRVIRLEEKLRYKEVLPADLVERAIQLPIDKIIALRFASDEELPELVRKHLEGDLKTSKEIKMAVRNWRGDYLRA